MSSTDERTAQTPGFSMRFHSLRQFLSTPCSRRARVLRQAVVPAELLERRELLTLISVEITADRDNTIYDDSDLQSNGQGEHIVVGQTASELGGLRRGLIYFDLEAAGIPAGTTIDDAFLTLNSNQHQGSATRVDLHRLVTDWGEGSSDAPGDELNGGPASQDDATWSHAFFDTVTWQRGGQFDNASSASAQVSGTGSVPFSSTDLVSDVQGWSNDPVQNFGWILVGMAGGASTTRFDSAESTGSGPTLTVTFDSVNLPGTIQGRKWHDVNANGVRDSNEDYLNGWTIELVNSDGAVIGSTQTGDVDLNDDGVIDPELERGVYQFETLPGDYTVREVQQPGWTQSSPGLVSNLTSDVSGTGGEATSAAWYALDESTGELVFQINSSQLSGNITSVDIRTGSPGNNGASQYDLLAAAGGLNNDGSLSGEITLSNGDATRLGSGSLHIDLQTSGGDVLAGLIVNSSEHRLRVTSDSIISGRDFGNYQSVSISGRKWNDANADSVKIPPHVIDLELFQQGETYFENAYDAEEKWLRSADGGWYFLTPDGRLSEWDSTPFSATGTLVAQLAPTTWHNPDFILTAVNEQFLNGWTIELLNASGRVVASTRTRDIDFNGDGVIDPQTESGWYRFAGLEPGDYHVREVLQPGWHQSATVTSEMAQLAFDLDSQFDFQDQGKFFTNFAGAGEHWLQGADGTWYFLLPNGQLRIWDNASGGDNGPLKGTLVTRLDVTVYRNPGLLIDAVDPTISLASGEDVLNADFGNFEAATIEGRKWHDDNRDGARLPEIVIDLALAKVNDSFYFDAYGLNESWLRSDEGTWYFITPDGLLTEWDNTPLIAQGTIVAELNPVFAANPNLFLVPQNEPFLNGFEIQVIDEFGNVIATDITRDIDLNNDGEIDPELERGWYSFTDLMPGVYTLREIQQDGWVQTSPAPVELAALALELDQQFGFTSSGDLHRNFGNLDEVWIQDSSDNWYYILPDGSLFEWDELSTDPLVGTLIAELSPAFHANPALLYNAQPIDVDALSGQTVSGYDFGNDLEDDVV